MEYPDGEKVTYDYDLGGNLNKMTGVVNDSPYSYIKRIDYDQYEQRTYLLYGNKTETFYNYSSQLRRLEQLNVKTPDHHDLFNNKYTYDNVGNVTNLVNNAPITVNNMAGNYNHDFVYDNLNRLFKAKGKFVGSSPALITGNDENSDYDLKMTYNDTHGITGKEQSHNKNGLVFAPNTYKNKYEYLADSHKVEKITDTSTGDTENFGYDLNGNTTTRVAIGTTPTDRQFYWDESNRLRVFKDNNTGYMQHYIYDASGERILKSTSDTQLVFENGTPVDPISTTMNGYTTYPSANIVVDASGNYSKHYYAGSQRIVSRLAGSATIFESCSTCRPADAPVLDEKKLQTAQQADLQQYADQAKKGTIIFKPYKPETLEEQQKALDEENQDGNNGSITAPSPSARATEGILYFYHPDHLGTSSALTDINGVAYQFFLNLPFGETMAEQSQLGLYHSPYKFNGKELDDETGFYYYGARYYDPRISIWASVDPLAEKFVAHSPYNYCFNNPVRYNDPTGMEPTPYEAALMADDVYTNKGILAGGWNRSSIGSLDRNQKNGLQAQMYQRTTDSGEIEYAYVYAGTDPGSWPDWKNNAQQVLALSSQYDDAEYLAKTMDAYFKKNGGTAELTFVGHSLGGGLANYSSLVTGRNSITFNPAWISTFSLYKNHKKGKRNNWVHESDPLNGMQQTLGSGVGLFEIGKHHEVNGGWNLHNNAIFGHLMGTMIERMRANGETKTHRPLASDGTPINNSGGGRKLSRSPRYN
jgi:RHS repeat-associated protein